MRSTKENKHLSSFSGWTYAFDGFHVTYQGIKGWQVSIQGRLYPADKIVDPDLQAAIQYCQVHRSENLKKFRAMLS